MSSARVVLVLSLIASQSFSAIVAERLPKEFHLFYRRGKSVLVQACGDKRPVVRAEIEPVALECEKRTGKKPADINSELFERNLSGMYLVPYSQTGTEALKEAAADAELERRKNGSNENPDSSFSRLLDAQTDFLDYLDEGERFVSSNDSIDLDILFHSTRPVYSDGRNVFRLSEPVPLTQFEKACHGPWAAASVHKFFSVADFPEFAKWIRKEHATKSPGNQLWAWNYHLANTPVGDLPAYTDQDQVLMLFITESMTTFDPAPVLDTLWQNPVSQFKLPENSLYSINDNRDISAICYRRASPQVLRAVAAKKEQGTIAVVTLLSKYNVPNAEAFKRRVYAEETEPSPFATELLLGHKMLPEIVKEYDKHFTSMFAPEKPRFAVLNPVVQAEKARKAKERADEIAAEQRRVAEAKERERVRRANQFTVAGVVYDSNADFERRNPGWHWNEARGTFVGPAKDNDYDSSPSYRSGSSSNYSSGGGKEYQHPDGSWKSYKYRGPGYYYADDVDAPRSTSTRSYSTRSYTPRVRTYSSGGSRITITLE